ncbi:MAG: LD-carboxypeptidase [Paludibacteraceae bacterium]|nr:LD-carboxypeptidase [Paludibacteraceae bacterium]
MHIRIISPSGAIDPVFIDQAAARLRGWGHEVSEGTHARGRWGRFAGTDEERLEDIQDAMQDPSVDAILCSRGGYGLQRIIDRVPNITKPVIGFSDITALHQLSTINCQLSIHAIMCKHIATLPEDSEPIVALRRVLEGKGMEYRIAPHPLNRYGEATAPVIGGNLSVLYGLQGTPYDIRSILNYQFSILNYQKPLLLIEDVGERHYHIDRMIRNLKMSGVLGHLGGLVVGQFSECEHDPGMNCTVYETIKEAVAEYDYPVLFNAPFGHVEHNLPIWLGKETQLSVTAEGSVLRTAPLSPAL